MLEEILEKHGTLEKNGSKLTLKIDKIGYKYVNLESTIDIGNYVLNGLDAFYFTLDIDKMIHDGLIEAPLKCDNCLKLTWDTQECDDCNCVYCVDCDTTVDGLCDDCRYSCFICGCDDDDVESCEQCDSLVCIDCSSQCGNCKAYVCDNCSSHCNQCGYIYCNDCLDEYSICKDCRSEKGVAT